MIDKMPDVRLDSLNCRSIWMIPADIQVFQRYSDGIRDDIREQAADNHEVDPPLTAGCTDHGFANSASPTMIPSAPVSAWFATTSSHVRTFPLLTTGTRSRSLSTFT